MIWRRFTNPLTNIWDLPGPVADLTWVCFLIHVCWFDFSSVNARFDLLYQFYDLNTTLCYIDMDNPIYSKTEPVTCFIGAVQYLVPINQTYSILLYDLHGKAVLALLKLFRNFFCSQLFFACFFVAIRASLNGPLHFNYKLSDMFSQVLSSADWKNERAIVKAGIKNVVPSMKPTSGHLWWNVVLQCALL